MPDVHETKRSTVRPTKLAVAIDCSKALKNTAHVDVTFAAGKTLNLPFKCSSWLKENFVHYVRAPL